MAVRLMRPVVFFRNRVRDMQDPDSLGWLLQAVLALSEHKLQRAFHPLQRRLVHAMFADPGRGHVYPQCSAVAYSEQ